MTLNTKHVLILISDVTNNPAGENYPHPPAHDDLSGHLGALLVEDREVVGGHRG